MAAIRKEYIPIKDKVRSIVRNSLNNAVADDYIDPIVDKILPDVVNDVAETSGFLLDGDWTDGDVALALGRVLMKKFHAGDC